MAHRTPEVLASAMSNPRGFQDDRNSTDQSVGEECASVSLSTREELHANSIRSAWEERVRTSANIDVLFQSPIWYDHIAATDLDKRLAMAVARNAGGQLLGLAPLIRGRFPLRFEVKSRLLWNSAIPSVFIFGGGAFPPRPILRSPLRTHRR